MQFEELLDNLYEEYADQKKKKVYGKDKILMIYKNPSNSEFKKMVLNGAKQFRIILDIKNKDAYAFNSELLHAEVSKILFSISLHGDEEDYRTGWADEKGQIIHVKNFSDKLPSEKKINNSIRKWVMKNSRLTWGKEV